MKIISTLLWLVFFTAQSARFIPLFIHDQCFTVEIADTEEKRLKGLMFREDIRGDYGMLFIFENEDWRSFWMKNCLMSIDIIFLDKNKQVIDIYTHVPPCAKEPCESYMSSLPAMYVLELRAKRSEELKLKKGDVIFFNWPIKEGAH